MLVHRGGGCRSIRVDENRKAKARSAAMRAASEKGPPPALLAYAGDERCGLVRARASRAVLDGSLVRGSCAPVDDTPVWSVTCFFVRRDWRRRG